MLLPNATVGDPDTGTFNVYGASHTGGNTSASHYGKKRTDIADTDCAYCHQNTSTLFPLTQTNRSMQNHTNRTNGPSCWNESCHKLGTLHDSNLTKPSSSTASIEKYFFNS